LYPFFINSAASLAPPTPISRIFPWGKYSWKRFNSGVQKEAFASGP
jgi:hypothetical protein